MQFLKSGTYQTDMCVLHVTMINDKQINDVPIGVSLGNLFQSLRVQHFLLLLLIQLVESVYLF